MSAVGPRVRRYHDPLRREILRHSASGLPDKAGLEVKLHVKLIPLRSGPWKGPHAMNKSHQSVVAIALATAFAVSSLARPHPAAFGDLMTAFVRPCHIELGLAGSEQNWLYGKPSLLSWFPVMLGTAS